MTESKIVTGAGGTMFVGPDAARLFQATVLRSALGLLTKGILPTRGYTMRRALEAAGQITGKKYSRKQVELARDDLKKWCDEMNAALPKESRTNE